jgi:hypothetical protein
MTSLDQLQAHLQNQPNTPPIERWHPDLSGDIDIVIKADGRWIHEGGEIKRHQLVKLFASILRREDDGHYYLVTPVEKWRIQVEDLPLVIVDFELEESTASRRLIFKTNVDTWFELSSLHPISVSAEIDGTSPQPSVLTRHGLAARVSRACFYRLVDIAETVGESIVLRAGDETFVLGKNVE